MALDALEQHITDLLTSHGATDTQIEMYLDDVFAFSDKELYTNADDETIISDFENWMEE
jgi:hypothetical protein